MDFYILFKYKKIFIAFSMATFSEENWVTGNGNLLAICVYGHSSWPVFRFPHTHQSFFVYSLSAVSKCFGHSAGIDRSKRCAKEVYFPRFDTK